MAELDIPELSLVLLIGASGSGKSVFAERHFGAFEVISSDFCRGLVSSDPANQAATEDAFEVLGLIAAKRLRRGLLTVVDATNVQAAARRSLIALAREHDVLPVGLVLDLPEAVCLERNRDRPEPLAESAIRRQVKSLRQSLKGLGREGLRHVHRLTSPAEVDAASIRRTKLYNDRRDDLGPFDVIGDVHGCLDELTALLVKLGYELQRDDGGELVDAEHPDGRRAVFLGDLIDRGPATVGTLRLVMGMTAARHALAVPGNHEAKLVRALGRGAKVQLGHGLAETLAQLEAAGPEFTERVRAWCDGLISHYVLDEGRLVVAHAGLKEAYHGRASGRVRAFALYGDTTGESDEFGLPVRYPWAEDYRGRAMVLYGHTPVLRAEWVNNTLCLDTGCVFGGKLSALRYPEKELVQVPASRLYCEPVRPLAAGMGAGGADADTGAAAGAGPEADGGRQRRPGVLDARDVLGKRLVETRWAGRVTVQAEQAAGAFEVMSRFAAAPERLAYLPPTMAPVASSRQEGYLEHPLEAFAHYAEAGLAQVICEEKHMGSRAVVWLARRDGPADPGPSAAPGAVFGGGPGIIHTRTGRPFFGRELEAEALDRLRAAVERAGLWDELDADWLMLDAELLPWSLKAEGLLESQYRPVAASAAAMYAAATDALAAAGARGLDVGDLLAATHHRQANAAGYARAVETYGWPVDGLTGVQIAPFQLLATNKAACYAQSHRWHLELADRLAGADPAFIRRTRRFELDPADRPAAARAVAWWEELTAQGGEGMVVKPMTSPVRRGARLVQAGLKVRGREYLRMTYGPDYLDRLDDLRQRNLGLKRSLALREYALGLEAIDRLVAGEPLWRRHEAVFAVLALESAPTDPRL
ncbi:MAG: polynucleotide kinase-phosphatase [Bifidobacteriaceae bacterium]|jgi:polynucleotide kinase-phosphatase|nr:polynucleotide kinase-phosphatase [Bifidobacteriaceae bacterium]